jgi:hypothetical protein
MPDAGGQGVEISGKNSSSYARYNRGYGIAMLRAAIFFHLWSYCKLQIANFRMAIEDLHFG